MLRELAIMAAMATTAAAQTSAELLQKGIYAQETAGDLDGAIKIYRQVVGSGTAARTTAATAQFRLAQTLLQKGDLEGAEHEVWVFSSTYPELNSMIKSLGPKLASATMAKRAKFGTASDYQHYRHTATGAQLTAPVGTSFLGDYASSENGELAVFGAQMAVFGGHQYTVSVWLKPEARPAGELAALARADIEGKAPQRRELEGWSLGPESIRTGGGPDRQWVHAIAEYTDNGRKMAEWITAYRTTKNVAFFFSRVPADRVSEYQPFLARMVELAVIP